MENRSQPLDGGKRDGKEGKQMHLAVAVIAMQANKITDEARAGWV